MYYVYLLRMNNEQIYTGLTVDLKRRVDEHIHAKVSSTAKRLPCSLIGYEAYVLKPGAIRRERYLKTTEGKRLFKQQYRDIIAAVVAT